jgi:multiple sugar transport system substrate-binding protein
MGIYVIWKFAERPDLREAVRARPGRRATANAVHGQQALQLPVVPGSCRRSPASRRRRNAGGGRRGGSRGASTGAIRSARSRPRKLAPIATALEWATNIGHPGPANPAESEIFDTFILPTMFANVVTGRMSSGSRSMDAHQQVKKIFEKWRSRGLVAGGASDL